MKLIRLIFSIGALILFVCIVAVASLYIFIDPNKLKGVMMAEVQERTGYQAIIEGNLSWYFYPKFGVKVEHMALKSPEQPSPFIHLYRVFVATDLKEIFNGKEKLHGDIYIEQINFMNVQAHNAHIGLNWQEKVLALRPLTASMYSGTIEGIAHGSQLSTAAPRWDWDVEFKQVELKPLLRDINGKDTRLDVSGLGEVQLRGSTSGTNHHQLLSNLNGVITFALKNGVLAGVDINYFVEAADAFISKQSINNIVNTHQTSFESLAGSAVITNGVALTDNLFLVSSAFSTKAAGRMDLTNQVINYQLQIMPLQPKKIHWAIPLLVTGDLNNPSIRLDILKLDTLLAKDQIEKAKEKVQEKIKELPAKADKFLKKLLGE